MVLLVDIIVDADHFLPLDDGKGCVDGVQLGNLDVLVIGGISLHISQRYSRCNMASTAFRTSSSSAYGEELLIGGDIDAHPYVDKGDLAGRQSVQNDFAGRTLIHTDEHEIELVEKVNA